MDLLPCTGVVALWLLAWAGAGAGACSEGSRPVLAALLDLHSGENCTEVTLHGIQQQAASRLALRALNARHTPHTVLQTVDSCSTPKGATQGTLRALVAAEQTCVHPPLFLGILGTERKESFEASYRITRVFNITHTVPHHFDLDTKPVESVHFMSAYPYKHHSQAMKAVLSKMGVRKVSLAYENTAVAKTKADHLMAVLQGDLCFARVFSLRDVEALERQLGKGQEEDALIFLVEDNSVLDGILDPVRLYEKHIVISAGKVGSHRNYFSLEKDVYILQMLSSSQTGNLSQSYDKDMVKAYFDQEMRSCLKMSESTESLCRGLLNQVMSSGEEDWTVELMRAGLELTVSRGLECGVPCRLPHKRPHNLPAKFVLYQLADANLQRLGGVEDGVLELEKEVSWEGGSGSGGRLECNATSLVVEEEVAEEAAEVPWDLGMKDLELIAFLIGIGAGILLVILAAFCLVYRTMRTSRSDTSSNFSTRS